MIGRLLAGLGVLALVVACRDDGVRPTQTATAADSADQILEKMEFNLTSDGVRRTRVIADTAYVYETTQLARLKKVKVTFFDVSGVERSTVVGDSGLYQMREGSMDAWGHVVGTTPDGKKLLTEELRYDSRKHEISSETPFTFDKPGDPGQHLTGNAFVSDPEFANVRASQPKGREVPGQNGGGGFLLPGQQQP
ncbi:MAG: LPS export ABC transporter periplasmic protein LptC [Gemmatimonadales bacterium]